ncbi:MAG: hypothetical protein SV760_05885 [Halobacteria archaeon]|nr:hypothetical protein [Halobacteria archaeon]
MPVDDGVDEGDGGPGELTLLLADSIDDREEEKSTCARISEPGHGVEEADYLAVISNRTVGDVIRKVDSHFDGFPNHLYVLSLSVSDTHGSEEVEGYDYEGLEDDVTEDSVSLLNASPDDLTRIGLRTREAIDSHDESDAEYLSVCYGSLNTLLQYHDVNTVFRFLHTVTGNLKSADALAHFHLNPDAVSKKELSTLRQLFDGEIECRSVGSG